MVCSRFSAYRWGYDATVHPHLGGCNQQRVRHVVAPIAEKCESALCQRLTPVFAHGQNVGQCLSRVELVGGPILDRPPGIPREILNAGLLEPAVFDPVVHTAEHSGRVPDGLFLA
jgi:hypothetical protein